MDKKKISIIVAIVVLVTIILGLFILGKNNTSTNNDNIENNNVVNNSSNEEQKEEEKELPTTKIEGTKTLGDLVFSDIKIVEHARNQNILYTTVKNNGTENVLDGVILNVRLLNESGDKIAVVGASLPFVAADSVAEMQVPIAINVMNTHDLTFEYANI